MWFPPIYAKKPDKYGMKLFLMCDCTLGYTFNGLPYTGREGDTRRVGLVDMLSKLFEILCTTLEST